MREPIKKMTSPADTAALTGPDAELSGAFDALYREHLPKVLRLALSLCGNPHDAEEVAQEAFSRAWRAYPGFRQECSFFTWIYRITLNAAKDRLKQRARFPVQALEAQGFTLEKIVDRNPANDPEAEQLARQARVRCLHALTECLPLEQRRVFCLAITLGLPHKAVAEILGCKVGAVKTALHRARQRWFGYMEERCQLIKPSNPCRCRQWVRFGLEQGWITKPPLPGPEVQHQERLIADLRGLRALRALYGDLHGAQADQALARRIQQGMRSREWALFSG